MVAMTVGTCTCIAKPIKLTEVPEDDWFCMDCAVDFADATVESESESESET